MRKDVSQPGQSPRVTVSMFWDRSQRCSDFWQALVFISESEGWLTHCFPGTYFTIFRHQGGTLALGAGSASNLQAPQMPSL